MLIIQRFKALGFLLAIHRFLSRPALILHGHLLRHQVINLIVIHAYTAFTPVIHLLFYIFIGLTALLTTATYAISL